MKFFKRKKQEIRADTTETSILTFFGITGEITREAAANIPTVSACINKIGETVSRLPIKLYRKDENIAEIKNDERVNLLNCDTGDTLSPVDMWKAAAEDYYLGGGAWIYVNSDGLKTKSLNYIDSRNISIMSNTDPIFKAFRVNINGREYYDFKFIKLLRKTRDGCTNIPLQQENSSVLSAAYNSLILENMMNSSGGCKPGFLKSKNRLSADAIKAIKDGYRKVYDNQETREKILVLNDGVEFEPISSTAAELQMNENKKTNSIEICKLFGFPHTIIDGGASDDDNKKFISAVISFLNQIETELDRVLLLETEKEQGFYFAFDTKELTRGNILERYQAYEIARKNNILQIDEIRREEDFQPLGFNFLTLNLSDVLINPETMEVFTPNTGQSKNLLTGEERAEPELRSRQWIKGEHGYFAGSVSTGGGGSSGGAKAESGISGKQSVKTDENTVDLDYINSDDFKNKFKGITDNTKVNEQIYSQSKAMLIHRNGTNKEDMCLINAETGKIEGRQTHSKSDFGVDYNESLNNAVLNNAPYSLISIHNHPTNNPPTGSDLVSNGSKKYKLGLVVTHNGRVFTYKVGNTPFLPKFFDNRVDENRKKGYNEFNAIIETLNQYVVDYGIEWSER